MKTVRKILEYSVRYCCSNCGFAFWLRIPHGSTAPYVATCQKCGCHKAHKVLGWGPA